MDNSDTFWKLIKVLKTHLQNPLTNDLTCEICKTILAKAFIGECGCRYCHDCASFHFSNDRNCCPGNTNKCAKVRRSEPNSIVIDHSTNIKLSELKVRCPKQECKFTCKMIEIENHIMQCQKKFTDCPFARFGCQEVNINVELVMKHLENASYTHFKLLSDHLLEEEKKSNDKQIENVEYFRIIDETMKLNFETLRKESKENEMNNLNLKKYLGECAQQEAEKDKEIKVLNEKLRQTEIKCEQINRTASENKVVIANMKQALEKSQTEFQNMVKKCQLLFDRELDTECNVRSDDRFTIYKKRYDLKEKVKNLELQIMKMNEFVWKIENFSNKLKEASSKESSSNIYSEPFYTHKNGYKMHLRLTFDGCGSENEAGLSVFFCIVKGDFDKMLTWPLKGDIIINLIDQDNGNTFKSGCFNYESTMDEDRHCFDKPGSFDTCAYGNFKFIGMSAILQHACITRNNSIVLTCLTRNLL